MRLPPRVFYTLQEAAVRWECSLADIAGWASDGRYDIVTGIVPVTCGDQRVAGYVAISPADVLPMFRRCGSGPRTCTLRRVRPLEAGEWVYITDPREGLVVEVADLLIRACEVHRFEGECDRNVPSGSGGGTSGRHDWDGMYVALIRRIHDHGVPVTQAAWIAEMQDWFARHSRSGDIPDERSIRRRVNPVWRMLREEA